MSVVAVLIDDLFEDVEYSKPTAAFENEGHELIHVGIIKGNIVRGKKGACEILIDTSVTQAKVDDFDALLIPGGYSPDRLRSNEYAVQFVKNFVESEKPMFLICHAPQILITANVLKGRKITGYKSIKQDIINSGAEYIDREVVEDGNLISSRYPGDIPEFIAACLKKL
ncbi:type 1 glutamine amidotransferase domain-containing protein [Methanobacterium alcaliphilum]|uniref:type 1 glutamine amidotransferase domain-containing protein n=1 Tax=Methanobacterium alcaliphilum TaxID=392018 RepID=UPI002009E4C9|nr:type 1 glutamine amidotransferase domain-containing protein [Methanobacterium alcaliphilum]MCK9152464.1 type 1 glutamine amidotransferase [Methanobacterium alcaliphilum]